MKTYIAVFAALLAASTSSLLSAPAMASEGCSTVAQCLGHDSSSVRSDRSNDDNGMGHTERNERNERNGNDDNGRGESDHGAGHDGGSDHNGGSDNDD
ncbi:hypothetical protein DFR48_103432 [Ciceribacter lividus]|uniref:Pentapeptide MXKDX repeat protein n=1 Tax=Ciceribacter lividus TaxID=1197950 RepID=A0A6I7HQF1_9HYPH|nr:hypothetical protein [Ciceribacter lividus]RCW27468.1 hypothetical protein DFR48_103432 [Ciceribacter lividus]